jgi:hypothetical protein
VISTALIIAIMLMLVITAAPAAELPEGVTLKVLDEFPSEIRGMEKIQLQELRLEPGAKWENYIGGDMVLCTVKQGELTVAWAGIGFLGAAR